MRTALLICNVFLLAACSGTPLQPAVKLSPAYQQAVDGSAAVAGDWWRVFNDPMLDQLIARGLAGNHDARLALARVQQAKAGTTAAQSRLLPSLALTGSESDSRSGLPAPFKNGSPDTQSTRVALDLNWELDLFGAARAARRAAGSDLLAAEAGIDGTRLLVSSEIARQYFILRGARERLLLLDDILGTLRKTEELTRKRFAVGMASELDVELASGERLNTEALQPQLQTLVVATQARLAVLMGQDPSQPSHSQPGMTPAAATTTAALAAWPDLGPVAPGQPVELLARRPDLRAAEQQLAAESDRLKEARLNYLPKFFLNAVFGGQELTLNSIALSPVRYSNVALAFSAPLFNGRVRAGIEAQTAREQQALINYEKLILTAVEEVEVSLAALSDERRRNSLLTAVAAARHKALKHGESLYRAGQIDLLQLQTLQRAALAADQTLVESSAQRALNTIQLHKALGGSWQPPAAATPAIQTSTQS
ncbi:MAG: efflux transporter outer membrane subunit [Pseudomonadota bacterium]